MDPELELELDQEIVTRDPDGRPTSPSCWGRLPGSAVG
jgi:hypothetical protein